MSNIYNTGSAAEPAEPGQDNSVLYLGGMLRDVFGRNIRSMR